MFSSARHWWLYALAAMAALAVHLVLWQGSYEVFSRSLDFNSGPQEDFMGPYLESARQVFETRRPAAGFLYSPWFALLLSPLGLLTDTAAFWTWLVLQVLASAALVLLPLALVRDRPAWLGPVYLVVALTCLPLAHNLHWGQVSVLLALAVLAGVAADVNGRPRLAVLCVACAASIKFYPGLFLLVPLLREDWRTAGLGAAASLVLLAGVPALVLGPAATLQFYREILGQLEHLEGVAGAWADAPAKQFVPAVIARWTGAQGSGARLAFLGLGWLLAAGTLVLARSLLARRERQASLCAYAALALSLPLVVSPSWPHYLVLLPFAQLVVVARLSMPRAGGRDPLALGLVCASVLFSSAVFFRLLDDPEAYGRAGWLALADLALLAALYRSVLGDRHRVPPEPALQAQQAPSDGRLPTTGSM